jgi:hypothetical protein
VDRNTLTRRVFAGIALKMSAAMALPSRLLSAAGADDTRELKLKGGSPVEVPANFTGLGYEMLSVSTPGLLSAANHRYVKLIRGLGPKGVLRVGGIVANYTSYERDGVVADSPKHTVITRASLEQFAEFMQATGWTAIWSVNFAQGNLEQAVGEARAVSAVLGPHLLALEIGNEVDTYGKGQPFRVPPYEYATFRKEFEKWHTEIARAVPAVRFAAPDTASSVDWTERMAQDARGQVQLLTTHYYRNAQARGSAEQLLLPDPRLKEIAERLEIVSRQSGIPWRMCEMNSFSGGGRLGVSDTFVGALWTLNVMLFLAQSGCAGVNIETGVNQLGFVSSYSPVQDNGTGLNTAGVPYYGMLAFATAIAGCHQMFPLETASEDPSFAAYALGEDGKPHNVVVVNTHPVKDAHFSAARLGLLRAFLLRLHAPSALSTQDVTFGGDQVDASGHWQPTAKEKVRGEQFSVPAMSAAVLIRDKH